MLRNICRRGRLQALFQEGGPCSGITSLFSSALEIFRAISGTHLSQGPNTNTSHVQTDDAKFNGDGSQLSENTYMVILAYLQDLDPGANYVHRGAVPHRLDANVLTDYAQAKTHITWNSRKYSTHAAHPGGSSISYLLDDGRSMGAAFIEQIVEQSLFGVKRTFLVMKVHVHLSPQHEFLNPYTPRPGLNSALVYDLPCSSNLRETVIIEPERIVGHVPFRRCTSGAFGIDSPTMILVNSLHRERYRLD